MWTLYLAGPDVFLADAVEIGKRKREVCRANGFDALFPLDGEIDVAGDPHAIFRSNCASMRRADAGLFNLTPFRGPSADAGTLFELGFLHALEKPVYGYASRGGEYAERVRSHVGRLERREGRLWDRTGHLVEDFGLSDNLMIACALEQSGGQATVIPEAGADALVAMRAFTALVERLAKQRDESR